MELIRKKIRFVVRGEDLFSKRIMENSVKTQVQEVIGPNETRNLSHISQENKPFFYALKIRVPQGKKSSISTDRSMGSDRVVGCSVPNQREELGLKLDKVRS